MPKPLDIGIIGVGHLGRIHAELAAESPALNLVGVLDIDRDRCRAEAKRCRTKAFACLEELLDAVPAVSIVAPTEDHYSLAMSALEHGCHLFIEKPITAASNQARSLIALAKRRKRLIQVGHIERFNPAFQALAGAKLSPMFIESHRLSRFNPRGNDVSVILDLMIHDLDLVLTLIESPLQAVHACGVGVVSASDDIANVRLEFANGAVANLTSSRISAKDMRKMRIFEPNSYISVDFLEHKTEIIELAPRDSEVPASPATSLPLGCIGIGDQARQICL
ncbi:MAG: Gfo/Idh/MocA family protein, partial [Thermodesulfobacteriota bacterium]